MSLLHLDAMLRENPVATGVSTHRKQAPLMVLFVDTKSQNLAKRGHVIARRNLGNEANLYVRNRGADSWDLHLVALLEFKATFPDLVDVAARLKAAE